MRPKNVGLKMFLHGASVANRLRMMGYEKEAHEYLNLVDETKEQANNEAVPVFYEKFDASSENEFNKTFCKYFSRKRVSLFRETLLTDTDFQILQDIFPADSEVAQLTEIDFKSLIPKFNQMKQGIFSEKIIRNFIIEGKNFNCEGYLDFLQLFQKLQIALLFMVAVDITITDYITEAKLHDFVNHYVKKIESLQKLEDEFSWFKEFYVPIVVTQLSFHLCPVAIGKFDLYELITSKAFIQFIDMDRIASPNNPFGFKYTTSKFYNLYVDLDHDQDGFLEEKNMKKIDDFEFTDEFLSCMFDTIQAFEDGKLDFSLFLTVLMPMRNLLTRKATRFFFEILDVDSDGQITEYDINYFYKGMVRETGIQKHDNDSFIAELYDIIKCDENGITEEVLFDSGAQDIFFKLLIDVNTFKEWEMQGEVDDDEE